MYTSLRRRLQFRKLAVAEQTDKKEPRQKQRQRPDIVLNKIFVAVNSHHCSGEQDGGGADAPVVPSPPPLEGENEGRQIEC